MSRRVRLLSTSDMRTGLTSKQANEENPTEGFSVGLMESTSDADLPLRRALFVRSRIYGAII